MRFVLGAAWIYEGRMTLDCRCAGGRCSNCNVFLDEPGWPWFLTDPNFSSRPEAGSEMVICEKCVQAIQEALKARREIARPT